MRFYFCGKYINTNCEDKYIKRAIFEAVPFFRSFNDLMDMKPGKTILKITLVISL